jgi:hypothetical protein
VWARVDDSDDAWRAPPAEDHLGADLCLLRIIDEWSQPPPRARLYDFEVILQREFRAGGFPKGWDIDFAEGRVIGKDAVGLYLLRPDPVVAAVVSTGAKAHRWFSEDQRSPGIIYSRFSGAPVEIEGKIAGLIAQARAPVSDTTAYMIPVAAFPAQVARLVEDEYRTYLECVVTETDEIHISRTVIPGEKPGKEKPQPLPLISALQSSGKIVLIANPGLGKSTTLRHLELTTAADSLNRTRSAPYTIPIRIELKTYRGEEDLETLLAARVANLLKKKAASLSNNAETNTRILNTWLTNGRNAFLILLDGLDEVPNNFYQPVRSALSNLLKHRHRFVVSCRAADYDNSLQNCAEVYVLQALEEGEINELLAKKLGDKGKELFTKRLETDQRLLQLASNPLLLQIIASIAEENPDGEIPLNPGLLIKRSMGIMRERKLSEGFPPKVPPDIVYTALAALGMEMVQRKEVLAEMADIREWPIPQGKFDLDVIFETANEWRILLADGKLGEPIQFIHPLFGEYFAAEFLHGELKRNSWVFREVLGDRLLSGGWDQVLLMLAGICDRPKELAVSLAHNLGAAAGVGLLYVQWHVSWINPLDFWSSNFRIEFEKKDMLDLFSLSRVGIVFKCWLTSLAYHDPKARSELVGALRAVVRYSVAAIEANQANAVAEVCAAIEVLRLIGDKSAVEDLERFADGDKYPYRYGTRVRVYGTGYRRLSPGSVYEMAYWAAAEIRRKNGDDPESWVDFLRNSNLQ